MLDLSDELYARPGRLKIFVSSQMSGNVLDAERIAAAKAIDSTRFARAWYWERDARAGPYSAEDVCLGHARTSDGLVLIIDKQLTPVTYKEYISARDSGAPCYILLKAAPEREADVEEFIKAERAYAVTVNFQNLSELRTQITEAVIEYTVRATRKEMFTTRNRRSTGGTGHTWTALDKRLRGRTGR